MNLCLKDAFTSQNFSKTYTYVLTGDQLGSLPAPLAKNEVEATLLIEGKNADVTCKTQIKASFNVLCSRCATPIVLNFDVTTQKPVLCNDGVCDEDAIYLNAAYCFDVIDEIYAQINFEFPMAPLCKEDCKGLCPVCGCDLNTEQCSCDIRTVDPRLAVLKNLFD